MLLADDGLVVTSDTPEYAAVATAAAAGDGDRVDGLDDVVDASGSAHVRGGADAGSYACEQLAMAQADGPGPGPGGRAGRGGGHGQPADGVRDVRAAGRSTSARCMSFETDDQARANADSRAALAAGPGAGAGRRLRRSVRGGLGRRPQGRSVVLELRTACDGAYVVSDLSSGPVLFASC